MEDIPTELVVEILLRLPWTSRRRLRLVCRSWRDLVHQRTTEMQQCRDAVPLVVTTESAYVLDVDGHDPENSIPRPRQLRTGHLDVYKHMEVVGVCNGVLCLCDNAKPGGAITLVNPATGDTLALPPIPRHGLFRRYNSRRTDRSWHQAYSFGYHHGTGHYKVVHVPCFFKTKDTVQMFTVGEASWREVAAPNTKCKLDAGVSYWVTEGSQEKIISFDLKSERVKPTKPLPMPAMPICHLTEVQRRLSTIAIGGYMIKVWILESTGNEQAWIYQYSLSASLGADHQLTRPNFILGEYVLTVSGQGQKLFQWYLHTPYNYKTSALLVLRRRKNQQQLEMFCQCRSCEQKRRRNGSQQTGLIHRRPDLGAAAVAMEDIPTEFVVEILLRLPWTSRRRVRLVCWSWRDLVHQRTTEMQQCRDAVPLVVTTESAYVLDDLDPKTSIPRPRDLWAGHMDVYKHMEC
ncbi:hypothetical protein VPH35_063952 [Triticum aestivum]